MAFVEVDSQIALIDAHGVIMDMPAGQQSSYSFPVIVGMTDNEPLSTRAARMKIYAQLIKELDSGGAHYSQNLSDVDLSDPDDVKATVTDPQGRGAGASRLVEFSGALPGLRGACAGVAGAIPAAGLGGSAL